MEVTVSNTEKSRPLWGTIDLISESDIKLLFTTDEDHQKKSTTNKNKNKQGTHNWSKCQEELTNDGFSAWLIHLQPTPAPTTPETSWEREQKGYKWLSNTKWSALESLCTSNTKQTVQAVFIFSIFVCNNNQEKVAITSRGSKVQVWVLERLEEIKEKKLCSCIVIKSI